MVDGTTGASHPDRGRALAPMGDPAQELIDEVNFPDFVGDLIAGIFDEIVDESIRQMEAFSNLVGSVARSLQRFVDDDASASDPDSSPCPREITGASED